MPTWNPWHGCHKISPGCGNCYVYRIDAKHGKDSSVVVKTNAFNLPVQKNRQHEYKILPGSEIATCFSSDFFVEEADEWRDEAWRMMRERSDCRFLFLTKRIHRFYDCIPKDWGEGYPNVAIGCTVENQDRADFRLPIFKDAPIQKKFIICEPLLEEVDLSPYLGKWAEAVIAGGESGSGARECRYEWILSLRKQCIDAGVSFKFKQTGARFVKDGKTYWIKRELHHRQAKKAGIDIEIKE